MWRDRSHQNSLSVRPHPSSPPAGSLHHSGSRSLWLWREAWWQTKDNETLFLLFCISLCSSFKPFLRKTTLQRQWERQEQQDIDKKSLKHWSREIPLCWVVKFCIQNSIQLRLKVKVLYWDTLHLNTCWNSRCSFWHNRPLNRPLFFRSNFALGFCNISLSERMYVTCTFTEKYISNKKQKFLVKVQSHYNTAF